MTSEARAAVLAVTVIGLAGVAFAQSAQLPARRAGQWRSVMTVTGMPSGMTMTFCVDPATERSYSPFSASPGASAGSGAPACGQRDVHPIPGGWSFSAVCNGLHGQPTRTFGTVTGDFRSHIHVAVDTQRASGVRHMSMEQTWLGACPAGGGRTVTLPNGQVITIPTR